MTDPRPRQLIVVDCETNGLDPDRHDVWEFSWWNLTTGDRETVLPYLADLPTFMANSSLNAFRVNHFVDRWTPVYRESLSYGARETTDRLIRFRDNVWPSKLDDRAVIVAAQPKFDLPFISKALVKYEATADWAPEVKDRAEPWFYRAIDISSWGGGVLGLDPRNPESASSLAARLGVYVDSAERHTAHGDVTLVGRTMLLLEWIRDNAPGFTLGELDKILESAPQGSDIDSLIG